MPFSLAKLGLISPAADRGGGGLFPVDPLCGPCLPRRFSLEVPGVPEYQIFGPTAPCNLVPTISISILLPSTNRANIRFTTHDINFLDFRACPTHPQKHPRYHLSTATLAEHMTFATRKLLRNTRLSCCQTALASCDASSPRTLPRRKLLQPR